jgi:hypothetical protein
VRPILTLAYKRKYLTEDPRDWLATQEEQETEVDHLSAEEMQVFLAALPRPHTGFRKDCPDF